MEYADFKNSLSNKIFHINGKSFSLNEISNWIKSPSESKIESQVKAVYQEFLFSEADHIEIFTSGSTGAPKLIRHSKEKVFHSAQMSNHFFQLGEGKKVLLVLPPEKIGGRMLIIRSIVGGMDLYYVTPRLNPFSEIRLSNFDFCSLTPAQLATIIKDKASLEQLRKIKKILLGGSEVTDEILNFTQNEHTEYFHSYGMTETISHVAIRALNGENKSEFYTALDDVNFELKEETGQLIIHAPTILKDSLLTNDIVEIRDYTSLKWLGRLDNIVNSGGIKLVIEEIEKKIKSFFKGEFFLTSEKDDILGEKLVIIVKNELKQIPKLKENINRELDRFERPKMIYIVNHFPVTDNGKIIRKIPSGQDIVKVIEI